MDVRDTGEFMGWAALAEAVFASCVIPGTLMVVIEIGIIISNPGAMAGAAGDWKQVASQVEALKNEMENLANGVPPDKWQGHDRAAFDDAVQRYKQELTKAHQYHGSVGDMLDVVSWVFFALAAMAFVVATIMAVQAAIILAAAATVVGALAVPSLEGEANGVAAWIASMLSTVQGSVRVMLGAVMAILTAGEMTGTSQMMVTPDGGPPMFKQVELMMGTPKIPTLGAGA